MREAKEKEIDGVVYRINQMAPTKASVWVVKLLGIVAPALALCGGAEKIEFKDLMKLNVTGLDLSKGLSLFFEKVTPDDFLKLQRDVLLGDLVTFSKEGGDFKKVTNLDLHFAQFSGAHMMKVLMFALEVNFKDFLPALAE